VTIRHGTGGGEKVVPALFVGKPALDGLDNKAATPTPSDAGVELRNEVVGEHDVHSHVSMLAHDRHVLARMRIPPPLSSPPKLRLPLAAASSRPPSFRSVVAHPAPR